MKKIYLLSVASAALLFAACSGSNKSAATDSTTVKTDSTTVSAKTDSSSMMSDTTFASKAAVGGMAEVALGKMALSKTSNAQIKSFANMMVMDHGKANEEL